MTRIGAPTRCPVAGCNQWFTFRETLDRHLVDTHAQGQEANMVKAKEENQRRVLETLGAHTVALVPATCGACTAATSTAATNADKRAEKGAGVSADTGVSGDASPASPERTVAVAALARWVANATEAIAERGAERGGIGRASPRAAYLQRSHRAQRHRRIESLYQLHYDAWSPTPKERAAFDAAFEQIVGDTGRMFGSAAVHFFAGSLLPSSTLRQVWAVADAHGKGTLGRAEFYVAMRLIAMAQARLGVSSDALTRHRHDTLPLPNLGPGSAWLNPAHADNALETAATSGRAAMGCESFSTETAIIMAVGSGRVGAESRADAE